jgi:PadR family transcriptional regulator AphA
MSNPLLTSVSYVVLGLVRDGAATSYEMKQKVATSVGYFWNFPHSQLYAEPARLVDLGLLAEKQEEGGRHRRIYTLTDAGRDALAEWLRQPAADPTQIRDVGLLKLFFGEALGQDDIVALARAQEEAHRARLAVYEEIAQKIDHPHRAETLRAGLLFERTFAEFWREVAATRRLRSSRDSEVGRR